MVFGSGASLGGVQVGGVAAFERSRKERAFQETQDVNRFNAGMQLFGKAEAGVNDLLTQGQKLVAAAPDRGQITPTIDALRGQVQNIADMVAQLPGGEQISQTFVSKFNAGIQGTETANEKLIREQKELAAKAETTTKAKISSAGKVTEAIQEQPKETQATFSSALGITPARRQIAKDVTGVARDVGTGERIFPGVQVPSAEETAVEEEEAKIAAARTRAQAISPDDETRQTELFEQFLDAEKKNIKLLTFKLPDDSFRTIRADDTDAFEEIAAKGGVAVPLSIQATKTEDLLTRAKGLDKTQIREAQDTFRGLQSDLKELDITDRLFKETPEAGGLGGAITETVGGLLQQDPTGAGERIVEGLNRMTGGGFDPGRVTQVRTQARNTVSRMLRAITQEESGRYTEAERTLAKESLKALELKASNEQIGAAFDVAIGVNIRSLLDSADTLRAGAGISVNDLKSQGGIQDAAIEQMLDLFESNGMSEQQAFGLLQLYFRRRNIQLPGATK